MPKLFFFHCPKAGGTSISRALEQATPRELIAPLIENDAVGHALLSGYQEFRGYSLYSGHYGKDVFDAVEDGHVPLSCFRHPVSRIISLYNYFRDQVSLPAEMLSEERYFAVKYAKMNAFENFVACNAPRLTVYTRNQHLRQLTRSPWDETPGDLDQAQDFVRRMICFYVCEFPELSAKWLCDELGLATIGHDNAKRITDQSIRFNELERKTIDDICQYNAGDLRLYRFAVDRLLSV